MKKLLMLGGSPYQVKAVRKAKEMGHYVIICDYLEDNPGRQFCDEYYNISTTDKERILELAKSLKVDGILCYTAESGAQSVAFIAEKLGLPSFSYNSVKILSNKDMFRIFLKENQFNVIHAKGYATLEDVKADIQTFTMPVMIKPVDSSGSRGISKINSIELLSEKVKDALSFSRTKRFIVEEYIDKQGYQVGGECFLVNGNIQFFKLVNYHFNSNFSNPFLPTGVSWPCNIANPIQDKIYTEIQRLVNLLNIKTGPLIFEVLVDQNENIYIIDIGVINNSHLNHLINFVEDVDLIQYAIKAALGEDCSDLAMIDSNGYWATHIINSEKNGVLKKVEYDDDFVKKNLVKYNEPLKCIGSKVKTNEAIGSIILKFSSMNEMLEKMDNIGEWVKVIVEEENLVKS